MAYMTKYGNTGFSLWVGLSTDIKPMNLAQGTYAQETDTPNGFRFFNGDWHLTHVHGIPIGSSLGLPAQPHDKIMVGVTDVVTKTRLFTEEQSIHKIRCKVTGGVDGDSIKLVFDAGPVNDASDQTQANLWLASITTDVITDIPYRFVVQKPATDPWNDWIPFAGPLRRVDAQAFQVGVYTINIEVE